MEEKHMQKEMKKNKMGFLFKELYEALAKEQHLRKKVINREVSLTSAMFAVGGIYFFMQEELLLASLYFVLIVVAFQVKLRTNKKIEKEVFAKWQEYYALYKKELPVKTINGPFEVSETVEGGFTFRFLSLEDTDAFIGQLSDCTLDELQTLVEVVEEKKEEGMCCLEGDLVDFKGNVIHLEKTLIQKLYIHKEKPLLDYVKQK